jgi:hypothetical protein
MRFLGIWAFIFVAVLAVLRSLSGVEPSTRAGDPTRPVGSDAPNRSPWARRLGLGAFALLFAGYAWLIEVGEDFAFNDDDMFTEFTLQGKAFPPPIWPTLGRFFPFGHQEFNLLRFVTTSIASYHAVAIVELLLAVTALFVLLNRYPLWFRVLVATLELATASIAVVFFGLCFPERNVILFLSLMLMSYRLYLTTGSYFWFVSALACVQFGLYYKETAFLIFGGFAGTRLLVFYARAPGPPRERFLSVLRKHRIDAGVLLLALAFLALYAAWIRPHSGMGYATSRGVGSLNALRMYLSGDPWLAVFVPALVARGCWLLRTHALPDTFWDPLALGASLYLVAFVKLGMFNGYYTAPVDFVACLYVAALLQRAFSNSTRGWRRTFAGISVACAGLFVFGSSLLATTAAIVERKAIIGGKRRLVDFLSAEVRGAPRHIGLFFPNVDGYEMMLVASFMQYKGLSVADDPDLPAQTPDFVFRGRDTYPDNKCVDYRTHRCFHRAEPGPGDLTVILPEAKMSKAAVQALVGPDERVFHYEPEVPPVVMALLRGAGRDARALDSFVFRHSTGARPAVGL